MLLSVKASVFFFQQFTFFSVIFTVVSQIVQQMVFQFEKSGELVNEVLN